MEQKTKRPASTTISLKIKNNSSRKAIVFVHGNSSHSGSFVQQWESPLFSSYQCVSLDLPGHGDSEQWPHYDIPAVAAALATACNELEVDSFVIVGHSLGGHLALQALPNLPKCEGLFLCGTPPLEGAGSFPEAFLPNPVAGLLFKGTLQPEERKLFAQAMAHESTEFDFDAAIGEADPAFREGMGLSLQNGGLKNEIGNLEANNIPLALVLGSKDPLIHKDYVTGRSWPRLWQNKVQCIEGAGHSPFLENPKKFNTLLSDFLTHVFKTEK